MSQADVPPGFEKWVAGNRVVVNATDPESGEATTWRYEILGPGDARITREMKTRTGLKRASTYLYGGRLLVSRGVTIRDGFESDLVDYPAMVVNLVFELLARGVPAGPEKVDGAQPIDVSGGSDIVVATDTAYARFRAPWTLRGKVWRGEGESVAFDLAFAYRSEKAGRDFEYQNLRGQWSVEKDLPLLDPQMRVDGYDVFLLGSGKGKPGGSRLPAERLSNLTTIADAEKLITSRDMIEKSSQRLSNTR